MGPYPDTAVFVRVVDEGGFTAAAETLGLSKGAVSKVVSRLEARLGARLLNRTTRRLTLTEVGETFYRRAAVALAELEEAESEVAEHTGKPRGYLRVSAPAFYGAEILSRHLSEFQRRYPDISLELMLENRLVNLVEERYDVAIRMSAPRDSSLVMRKLAKIPLLVCASPAYLSQRGSPETPEELREHECLIYLLVPRPHEWAFVGEHGERYTVMVEGRLSTNDDHALRQAAIDGLGILRMPELFVRQALNRGELVQLWPEAASPGVTLAVVYPSRRELPGKVRAFVDYIAEVSGAEN
jgi:DNA-binding transcriptional LysR family regulator